jgi:hypothetical protein
VRRLQTLVPELLKVRAAGEAPTDEEHPPDCQGASSREVICRIVEVEQGPDADAVEVRVEAQAAPHELEAQPLGEEVVCEQSIGASEQSRALVRGQRRDVNRIDHAAGSGGSEVSGARLRTGPTERSTQQRQRLSAAAAEVRGSTHR